jgi:osmotically-inducible protein OsmY
MRADSSWDARDEKDSTMSDSATDFGDDAPPSASQDEIIARLVVDELYWDNRVDASKVQVEATDGVVTLTGHVPTCADRYSAEADARMIRGVVTVVNHIEVDRPKGVPDRELQSDVSTVLSWAPDVDATDINVSAKEGVVTLKGTVPSYWGKLRAHLLAAQTEGVIHVVDELAVTPSQNVTDREIAGSLLRRPKRCGLSRRSGCSRTDDGSRRGP